MTHHFPHRHLLSVVTLGAVGDQGIGNDALQSGAFLVALAFFQEAVQVVLEQTVICQNRVDVYVVVFAGVEISGVGGCDEQNNCN